MRIGVGAMGFCLAVVLCCSARPAEAADQPGPAMTLIHPSVASGAPLVVRVCLPNLPEHEYGVLLFDALGRLVGARWLPAAPVMPSSAAAATTAKPGTGASPTDSTAPGMFAHLPPPPLAPAAPAGRAAISLAFPTAGLPAGWLTVKYGFRIHVGLNEEFIALEECQATLTESAAVRGAAPATAAATWRPDQSLRFFRGTPLPLENRNDWVQLLADTGLSGPGAPFDGPVVVVPRGATLSAAAIAAELQPVIDARGLVICETWPTPSMQDALKLGASLSPQTPAVQLPDIGPVEALTGDIGPAIPADPDPATWGADERLNRLLARRDPQTHRLFGVVEQSFGCLESHLQPRPGTGVFRFAADGAAAVTVRPVAGGGAVVVLNAAVSGYAAASRKTATAVDFLGVSEDEAQKVLAGAHGGVALRSALDDVRSFLASRLAKNHETGAYWRLYSHLTEGPDGTVEVHCRIAPTARTLAGWTPPAALSVRLMQDGELQGSWTLPLVNNAGSKVVRIPLSQSGADWAVEIADPFTGREQRLPVTLGPALDLEVIDAPGE
ncbi:MAG: hypothetical protein ACREJ2_18605 [Planctomycetota bacterium]